MLYSLLYGLATGTVLSLMLGTVFFALIQNSVDNGYKSGLFIASGVVLSDCLFITAAILGTSALPDIPRLPFYSSLLGGILLIFLGVISIVQKDPKIVYPKTRLGNITYYFTTGFLLNILNPVNFFFWVAIATQIKSEKMFTFSQQVIFFTGCLAAIFLSEVGISFSAYKLKSWFTPKVLQMINRVTGVIFAGFGLKLLYEAFYTYL
ncbi:LysE family transporter [Emticicia sp. CRIBPO]|uniref:LysE family translocator n=1 Tax=Emticicia sp. CRIBPO TaxID=2683258 RepID=UPI0014122822|nr:LysE family transporter [Emticicia sp. CRIBPO]NBA89212.1 LysE family transporter [Emticicia sp. CRIBPO]